MKYEHWKGPHSSSLLSEYTSQMMREMVTGEEYLCCTFEAGSDEEALKVMVRCERWDEVKGTVEDLKFAVRQMRPGAEVQHWDGYGFLVVDPASRTLLSGPFPTEREAWEDAVRRLAVRAE